MHRRNAQQLTLNFNPIELKDEERDRIRRAVKSVAVADEMEYFEMLPGETMAEFFAARELHMQMFEAYGEPSQRQGPIESEAWLMIRGQLPKPAPPPSGAQLRLSLD